MAHESPGLRKVSVIVPCRNEARHLVMFLDSLLEQNVEGLEVEFLVADGMSDDGTRDILAEYAKRTGRIRMIDNLGRIVSTGLNSATQSATGEIILRMDAHTEFAPDYIQTCVTVLDATGADNVGGPARTKAVGLMARAIAAAYHSPFSTGGAKFHDVNHEGPVDTVTYGCWRKSTLERIGGFDEELVRNQDDELNLRLIRAGGRVWQSPLIRSWYHPRGDLRSLFRQYFQYGFWKVAVIRKHRIPASWRHLVPCTFVLTLLALAMASLIVFAAGAALPVPLTFTVAAVVGAYTLSLMYFSWRASRDAGADLLPILPLVFGTYHISYGFGFLAGLLWRHPWDSPGKSISRTFTELSR
jgi:succinoglycan biosynthesis protein ExoA